MRKLMILLLGAILIGILSYFCFQDKAGGIKDDLVSKAQGAYAAKQMNWVNPGIKGNNLEQTRIITLDGTAPTVALKAEAGRIALVQDGVDGVDNRLVVARAIGVVTPQPEPLPVIVPVDVEVVTKPEPIPVIDVEVVSKPEPIPIIDVVVPAKVIEKAPIKAVFSCQNEFKKILSSGKINFASSKADINPDSYNLLNALVAASKKCPKDAISIGGYSDSSGSDSLNKKLSAKRAAAVREYLITNGVSKDRLVSIGYGESKPIADNATADGRAKNRRIEFNVIDIKDIPKIAPKPNSDESELVEIKSVNKPLRAITGAVNFDDIPFAKTIKIDATDRNLGAARLGGNVMNVPTAKLKPHVVTRVKKPANVALSCQKKFRQILSSGKIQFAYNKADIKSGSHKLLNALASVVKECSNEIVIISGYTDSDGSESYNKRLSKNRASAVRNYLISRGGISSKRLKAVGYGESNPIADNSTQEGKAKNRRIEFNVKGVK